MHTLLDLRGNLPSFIHVSDGKLHDVHALDLLLPEAGAIYVMDRGYVDFARSMCCTWPEPSSSPAPNRTWMLIGSIPPPQTARPASFAIKPSHWTATTPPSITPNTAHPLPGRRNGKEAGVPHQSVRVARYHHRRALQKPLAKSNCSSNGSSSTCGSNASSAHPKMP